MSPHSALQSRPHASSPERGPGLEVASHEVEPDSGVLKLDVSGQEALRTVLDEVIINKKVHLENSSIIRDNDTILQESEDIVQGLENLLAQEAPTVEITDEHSIILIAASSEVVARLADPQDPSSPDSAEVLLGEQSIHEFIAQDTKSEAQKPIGMEYEASFYTKWARENRTVEAEQARLAAYANRQKNQLSAQEHVEELGLVDRVFAPVDRVSDRIEAKASRVVGRLRDRRDAKHGIMTFEDFSQYATAVSAVAKHQGYTHPFAAGPPDTYAQHSEAGKSAETTDFSEFPLTITGKMAKEVREALKASAEEGEQLKAKGEIPPVMTVAAAHLLEKTLQDETKSDSSPSNKSKKKTKKSRATILQTEF